MNIQAQPGLPPPLISSMAAANKPEKAPDNEAAEKQVATLRTRVVERYVKGDLILTLFAVSHEDKIKKYKEQAQRQGHLD